MDASAADPPPVGRSYLSRLPESAEQAEPEHSWMLRAVLTVTLANDFWFIWSNRFTPLSDFPDWIYQGYVFSGFIRARPLAGFAVRSCPVPDTTLTVILGVLDLVFAPEAAGKIVLCLALILFAGGSIYLFKRAGISEHSPVMYAPLVLMTGALFFGGQIAFLLGLGIFFVFSGYLIPRAGDRQCARFGIVAALACALYFTHFLAYLAGGIVAGILIVSRGDRRWRIGIAAAFAPSVCLTAWYSVVRLTSPELSGGQIWLPWTLHQAAGNFVAMFAPIQTFPPFMDPNDRAALFAEVVNAAACVAVLAVWTACAIRWWRLRRDGAIVCMVAACLLMFALMGTHFALVMAPGARFLYPALWLGLFYLGRTGSGQGSRAGWAVAIICAVLIAQGAYFDVEVAKVSRQLDSLYAELIQTKDRIAFCATYERYADRSWGRQHRRGLERFLPATSSVVRLPYHIFLAEQTSAPVFPTGILFYSGPGNYNDACSAIGNR